MRRYRMLEMGMSGGDAWISPSFIIVLACTPYQKSEYDARWITTALLESVVPLLLRGPFDNLRMYLYLVKPPFLDLTDC
jgi:hypothetical protein